MWTIFQDKFNHILPMSISQVFVNTCNIKLLNCKNVVDYTSCYQIAFNRLLSLIIKKSWISKKSIEIALQRSFLWHLGKSYMALVLAIKTTWTDETIDLSNTILRIICHAKINKRNEKDSMENLSKVVLATRTSQAPKKTYTTQECIDRGIKTHFFDWCLVKHSEFWARYLLRQMRTRGLNQSLKKATTPVESELKKTLASLKIESW